MKAVSVRIPESHFEALVEVSADEEASVYATIQEAIRSFLCRRGKIPEEPVTIGEIVGKRTPVRQPRKRKPLRTKLERRILMVGGRKTTAAQNLITDTLNPVSFEWVRLENKRLDNDTKSRILAADLILANRFISHLEAEAVRNYCRAKDREYRFLPKGFGPSAILSALETGRE
jgi:hypothetical protein